MADSSGIADIADMLRKLRATDRGFRVFGSDTHRYRVNPVLAEYELSAVESAYGIRLPSDYRSFLAEISNGGAGPYYGLEPLETSSRDLSKPFPFTWPTDQINPDNLIPPPARDEYGDYAGVIELCSHGCTGFSYMVVNGPAYGTVWDYDYGGDYFPTGLTFGAWYRQWLERSLKRLENEKLVSRLRVGMTRADIIFEVGGNWNVRTVVRAAFNGIPEKSTRLLESDDDIPAQVELDGNDIVVKVMPYPFL